METVLNVKSDRIKEKIRSSAEKSKETIRAILDSNTKNISTMVTPALKSAFGKSIELAEDALDSIIKSYTLQMELNVDFNRKLVDAIKEINIENPEKFLRLIHEKFEASRQLIIENTAEILDFYTKHTYLAMNFNQKFGATIKAQLESLFEMQNRGLDKFTEWASDWWKH
jgi:hypothetical protein